MHYYRFIYDLRERQFRRKEQLSKEKLLGFLEGIKSNSESFSQSEEEWQYNVGKGKSNAFHAESTANIMINGWKELNKKITDVLKAK